MLNLGIDAFLAAKTHLSAVMCVRRYQAETQKSRPSLLSPTLAKPRCEPAKRARFVVRRASQGVLLTLLSVIAGPAGFCQVAPSMEPIARRIPPRGIELSDNERERISSRLGALQRQYHDRNLATHPMGADIGIFLKAVSYALLHNEFYRESDSRVALDLLRDAEERMESLAKGKRRWPTQTGTIVRGYFSSIDNSPQPYGLVIPEGHDFDVRSPLYVWLHGRGDKKTDLHFIHERKSKTGEITPRDAMVLHPFGRHCVGFKSAGEIDVMESIESVCQEYRIDRERIVLMGFSMGGAGCWHIGAHYSDRFVAMSPGAGFAETADYNRLTRDNYPPAYEQKLWGMYDVPCYVRNLLNLPVVAYSGEKDKQIQAARIMESAFYREGYELPHIIGPGMGHKYHPDSLDKILGVMQQAVEAGRGNLFSQESVSLQTRTLRYNQIAWVEALGLQEHWRDSRIDAEKNVDSAEFKIATRNIRRLRLRPQPMAHTAKIEIDEQTLMASGQNETGIYLEKVGDVWRILTAWSEDSDLHPGVVPEKRPKLQGPIDDAFLSKFLVVAPTGETSNEAITNWAKFELNHLRQRWRALFRGDLPLIRDSELTEVQMRDHNLILFGDPASNRVLGKIIDRLPCRWNERQLSIAGHDYDAGNHVPLLIYPNPLAPSKYVVLNSGPTFRESHDRTNSLQNPKLPDWAVIDIRQSPNDVSPGRVVAADFFDEQWRVR